ncbi:TetR family transcriptional regulator [Streptomyces olivaceoviridis]|uniref:TetR family transcriptional regulator n=1 Tax=Streptomyces olivaceoviridis TaxID=1921 RepID=UPI0033183F2C
MLNAAAQLIAEKGYAQTTVGEILQLAGMSKGAMYNQFDDKMQLAMAVLVEGFKFRMQPIQSDMPRLQSVVDNAIALAVLTPQVPMVKAAARLATDQDNPLYGHLWLNYIPMVEELLIESRDMGELLPGVDPALTAKTWVAAYTGIDMMQRKEYDLLPEEIAPINAQMVRGIATPETLMRLDVSAERGYRLVREAQWEEGHLSGWEEREPGTGDADTAR